MMKYFTATGTLALAAGLMLAGCSGSNGGGNASAAPPTQAATYSQTELFARPAVKEGLESFEDHDATNRAEPYADTTLQGDVLSFMENVAGRSAATATAVQSIVSKPDEMLANLSQPGPASYLGVESGGATGGKFGGRALSDDAITLDLGVVFGNTLAKLGVVPDDHHESPCLTTDNVSYDKANTQTFPYVQPPV